MRLKKKMLGIILSLVLALGLMPGMRLTAHAAESKNIGTDVVYVAGDTIVLPDGGSYFKFDRYSNVEQKSGNSTVNTITNQYGDDYNIETSGDWSSYFNLNEYDYSESSQGLIVIGIKFSGSGTSEDPYIPLLAFGELDAVWEGDGEGTESSPYLINNVNDLKTLADNVKRGMLYGGKYFRLTSDIDCGEENWEPIGGTNQFRGTFDGAGNTVTYHITDNSENGSKGSGLFYGIAVSGTVKNLKVSGSIVGTSRYGNYYAGIAGINRGTIINCSSNVNITSPGCDIAGIAGSNRGTISYCAASGSITWNGGSNSYAYVAGMTGVNDNGGTVTNCTSLCDISAVNANGYSYASRVIGRNFGTVQNCYYLSSATITGDYVGTNNATEKTTDELKEIGDAAYNAGYNVYGLALGYMPAPTIKTQPEAKTLTYNGQAQELVTAGTAEGGTMQYALGTKDAATEEYTASIPTATNAGTYYVWYKVVGDSNHLDSDAGYVTVTIAPADSSGDSSDNTNTDTDTSAKVPYEDVAISTGSVKDITGTAAATAESNPFGTKIENNNNLTTLLSLTDAEVAQGVNVWLDVQDMSASVSKTDKSLIQDKSGDYTVGLYLDINLFKKVGSNDATKVSETKGKVKASIVIPESLWKSGRTFEIIRVHDGVATAIAGTYDENTHVFTFETDKFSTYALAYKDPASSSNSGTTSNSSSSNGSNSIQATAPKTGDPNDVRVWYLLLIASLGGLGFLGYSKKKEN